MDRRHFLRILSAVPALPGAAAFAGQPQGPAAPGYRNLLVLIELKGGNDGLNTVVPFADEEYYELRPRIAIPRDQVLQLDERTGLHPALKPLLPLWQANELAIVQGVGYAAPNLSHFRSIEIWDTACRSDEFLTQGWLNRILVASPAPKSFAADAVVVGTHDLGPFSGGGPRVIALANTERFLQQSRFAQPVQSGGNAALRHILDIERNIAQAANGLHAGHVFRTQFPNTPFGNAVRTASQVIASRAGVAVVKLSLDGFDTHSNQPARHSRLLQNLSEGVIALSQALQELGRWDTSLVMTYAEFGRRPRQNMSGGTDHGTANVHFLTGGRVRGGLHGVAPALDRLDGNGNLQFGVDFRELYAAVIERWWGFDSTAALRGRFRPVEVLRA